MINFPVDTLCFRLASESTLAGEEELLKTLQIDASFKGVRVFALWKDLCTALSY